MISSVPRGLLSKLHINKFICEFICENKFISYQYMNSHMKWYMNSYVINSYLNTHKNELMYKFIFEKT